MEPSVKQPEERKVWRFGTERAASPEESLSRARQYFDVAGITRIADLTWLDSVGIPVYQAVRPGALTLSVSQGKGLTPVLAQVSAAMEALELWHAEELRLPTVTMTPSQASAIIDYDFYTLPLNRPSWVHDHTVLEWVEGTTLVSRAKTLVPRQLLDLGGGSRLGEPFTLPLFRVTSSGLASGNTLSEAALHGLYELVERDCTERHRLQAVQDITALDPDSINDASCTALMEQFKASGVSVVIYDISSPIRIPAFAACIASMDLPAVHAGYGCHANVGIALSRALTEAAQVRLTVIAGVRDDLPPEYDWPNELWSSAPGKALMSTRPVGTGDFGRLTGHDWGPWFEENVRQAARLVQCETGVEPLMVDLTNYDLGLPVVFVVAPGLIPYAGEA